MSSISVSPKFVSTQIERLCLVVSLVAILSTTAAWATKFDPTLNPAECAAAGGSAQYAPYARSPRQNEPFGGIVQKGTYLGCVLPDTPSGVGGEGGTGPTVGPYIAIGINGPRFAVPGQDLGSSVYVHVANDGNERSGPFNIQLFLAAANGSEQEDFPPIHRDGLNAHQAVLVPVPGLVIPKNRMLEQDKICVYTDASFGDSGACLGIRIVAKISLVSLTHNEAR